MLILEIAAGIVLGVLALVYLRQILVAAVGLVIVGAGLALGVVVISAGWAGLLELVVLVAPIAGAVYLHKRRHPEKWTAPRDEEAASGPRACASLCSGGREFQSTFGTAGEAE